MSNIRMGMTQGIKLDNYSSNLPTDRRTRAHAATLLNNNWTETQYQSYLKKVLRKFTHKEKKVAKQFQANNFRQQVAAQVVEGNKVRYVGNTSVTLVI